MADPAAAPPEPPGLAARRIAADLLDGVLRRRRPLDEQLDGAGAHPGLAALADRDRALTRALVAPAFADLAADRPAPNIFTRVPAARREFAPGSGRGEQR